MNRLESLACCRLTEVPRLGTEPGAVGHRESHLDPAAWLAPALAPSARRSSPRSQTFSRAGS